VARYTPILGSERSTRCDPTALELEHLGKQIEVRVVVEDANGAILRSRCNKQVGKLDAALTERLNVGEPA